MRTITPETLAMSKSRTYIALSYSSGVYCLSEFCHNTHDLFQYIFWAFPEWGWLATTALKSALSLACVAVFSVPLSGRKREPRGSRANALGTHCHLCPRATPACLKGNGKDCYAGYPKPRTISIVTHLCCLMHDGETGLHVRFYGCRTSGDYGRQVLFGLMCFFMNTHTFFFFLHFHQSSNLKLPKTLMKSEAFENGFKSGAFKTHRFENGQGCIAKGTWCFLYTQV